MRLGEIWLFTTRWLNTITQHAPSRFIKSGSSSLHYSPWMSSLSPLLGLDTLAASHWCRLWKFVEVQEGEVLFCSGKKEGRTMLTWRYILNSEVTPSSIHVITENYTFNRCQNKNTAVFLDPSTQIPDLLLSLVKGRNAYITSSWWSWGKDT